MREFGRILGVSLTAVKGRLHRGREQVRERLLPVYAGTEHKSTTAERNEIMPQVKVASVLENAESKQHVIALLDEAGQRGLDISARAAAALVRAMVRTQTGPRRPRCTYRSISTPDPP